MADYSIYIAGPMRGLENNNADAFDRAEKHLTSCGWRVFNPIRIGRGIATDDEIANDQDLLHFVMRVERSIIHHCDAIYLLRGWEHSKGARLELAVAIRKGCEIILEPDDEAPSKESRAEDRE